MILKAASEEAYDLFHRGAIALSQVEHNGIRVDVDYLDKQIESAEKEINRLEKELKEDDVWKRMRKRFKVPNLGSRDQIAEIIFKELGYECKEWTEGKIDKATGERVARPKADAQSLRDTGLPFVKRYLKRENLIKDKNTFLTGIRREVHNGRLRAFFNLAGGTSNDEKGHITTYRSSSDSPNVHNFPTRDAERGKLIRSAFIPTDDDYVLIEADFKGIEVSIAYCYHLDPVMKKYLLDKKSDMHRDVAIQCFKLEKFNAPESWWAKKGPGGGFDVRHTGKNKFTFPQFYGDYWLQCAKNLWDDIGRSDMTTPEGVSLYDHLKANGIKKLGAQDRKSDPVKGTFEFHIKEVEYDFWKRRFKVYDSWKTKWWDKYLERGWLQMKTGFVCSGLMNKKQVINFPVQGAAFHCLLWCLIELQDWLNENKMKTKIVNQIHDSIILDVHKSEVKRVVKKLQSLMREELLKHWDWIVIPLEVDIGVYEKNWYSKTSYSEWSAA